MADDVVKYGFKFEIDDKGVLRLIDLATGKTRKLGTASEAANRTATKGNKETSLSFKDVLTKIGLTVAAYKALQLAMSGVKALANQLLVRPITIAADFETQRIQMLQFLGDMKSTRRVMGELAEFAAKTPFQLPGIVDANRRLLSYGGTALATTENLRLVGDAAATTTQPIQDMAYWFGRAYSAIQSGSPIGEVKERMAEFGLIIPGVFEQIDRLRKVGATTSEQWEVFITMFERTSGGMEKLSNTFKGRVSTMQDTWELFLKGVGENGPLAVAKTVLDQIIASLDKLRGNETLQRQLGERIAEGMLLAAEAAIELGVTAVEVAQVIDSAFQSINKDGAIGFFRDFADGFQEIVKILKADIGDLFGGDVAEYYERSRDAAARFNEENAKLLPIQKQLEEASRTNNVVEQVRLKEALALQEKHVKAAQQEVDAVKIEPFVKLRQAKEGLAKAEKEYALALAQGAKERELGKLGSLIDELKGQIKDYSKLTGEVAPETITRFGDKFKASLEKIGSGISALRGRVKDLVKEQFDAESKLKGSPFEADPLLAQRIKALNEYDKVMEKLPKTATAAAAAFEVLNKAYKTQAINYDQLIEATGKVQRSLDLENSKLGLQVLRGLRTEEDRLKDQLAILESSAQAMISSGAATKSQIDAAVANLRGQLTPDPYEEVDAILKSALPDKLVDAQVSLLKRYRDELLAIAQQAAPALDFMFGANIDTSGLQARVDEVNLAIASLQTSTVENGQPIFDFVGGLQSAFGQLFQGIKEGSIESADILDALYSSATNSLSQYLTKRIAALFTADTAEDVIAKKKAVRNAQESVSNTVSAQTGIFKAHSGIPFVGVALAVGFIALMLASLRKSKSDARQATAFAVGGRVTGPTQALIGEAGTEYVAPEKPFVQIVDELVRSRSQLAQNRQGGGGSQVAQGGQTPVQVIFQQSGPVFNTERDFYRKIQQVKRVADLEASR